MRLLEGVTAGLAAVVPAGQAVLFTVTAPIKRRAKTVAALVALVRSGLPAGAFRTTIEENDIRLRLVSDVPPARPRVLGFVHNLDADAARILALAEAALFGRD